MTADHGEDRDETGRRIGSESDLAEEVLPRVSLYVRGVKGHRTGRGRSTDTEGEKEGGRETKGGGQDTREWRRGLPKECKRREAPERKGDKEANVHVGRRAQGTHTAGRDPGVDACGVRRKRS